jgi:glycosyltransferase involved in cell wall biosynthesis
MLIVNDGSTNTPAPVKPCPEHDFQAIDRVDILHMRRNLGHQRAIAVGLAYIEEKVPCRTVVLMDSDGEDDPRDIPHLLEKYRQEDGQKIIFAERAQRSESITFRVFYWLYRVVHVMLTGRSIRVGNFSVIPRACLSSLVAVSEIWNHYAAAVFTSRQPFDTVPTTRAKRLDGQSKMNFTNLVIHGLSAISVYSDIIGVRLLLAASLLIVLTFVGLASTVALLLLTDLAIPGWATSASGMLLILLLQAIMFTCMFSFFILAGRSGSTFLPLRDYVYFVGGIETVYKR